MNQAQQDLGSCAAHVAKFDKHVHSLNLQFRLLK